MSEPLFEAIDQESFLAAQKPTKEWVTDPRTFVTWFKLPHSMGMCEVPEHDKVQSLLKPEQQIVRQKYPTRMIFPVNGIPTCRDCFMAGFPVP